MKVVVCLLLVLALVLPRRHPPTPSHAVALQGTEIHLTLLNGINMASAREGDPFIAVLARRRVATQ